MKLKKEWSAVGGKDMSALCHFIMVGWALPIETMMGV